MNANPSIIHRLAFFVSPGRSRTDWIALDQTGQPPRVIIRDDGTTPTSTSYDLISLDDAPLAIYRADSEDDYDWHALAAAAELVRVVNGLPNVSADHDAQMRELRDQLRHTVSNAEELLQDRDATIGRIQHKNERIRQEARRWKSKANAKLEVADYWEAEARRLAEIATERDAAASAWEVEATQRRSDVEALLDGIDRLEGVVTEMTAQLVDAQANALRTIDRISSALPITHRTEPGVVTADYTVTEDGSLNANTLRAKDATISRQLDTIRDQADMIDSASEKIEEAARNLSQATAERAEAWRDLDKLREERDAIHNERANLLADNERLREIISEKSATVGALTDRLEAEMNETRAAVRARDEADAMRRKLDARLGEERDAYIASSKALQTVIQRYADLAERGANLARHSKAIGQVFRGTYSDTAVELAKKYLEEHEKLIR